jgi:hypothetical protein
MGLAGGPVTEPQYPGLQQDADRASGRAQRFFLFTTRLHLLLLVAVGVGSSLTPDTPEHQRQVAFLVAGLMGAAFVVAVWIQKAKYDDRWFQCRALAENVKSLAWRYIMGVGAEGGRQRGDPDRAFIQAVSDLRIRLRDLASALAVEASDASLITPWMRASKALSMNERMELFRKHRLLDQIDWYGRKARWNARREAGWAAAIYTAEVVAIGAAVWYAFSPWDWNPVGAIATLAAAFVAWSQVKRHSELSKTYRIAADDLRGLDAQFALVTDEREIPAFVHQVETAISREHSVWLQQRGVG